MLITVAARPSAVLGPAGRKTWCAFDEGGRPRPDRRPDCGPVDPAARMVHDTSILVAKDVPSVDGAVAISAVSLAELHFGVLVATTVQ
ncbi:hypothetical protein Rruber_05424 (plasmid) [Rhodococcus ruber]